MEVIQKITAHSPSETGWLNGTAVVNPTPNNSQSAAGVRRRVVTVTELASGEPPEVIILSRIQHSYITHRTGWICFTPFYLIRSLKSVVRYPQVTLATRSK